jgi:predicted DNA-binding transcriptional regulator AlpA
MTSSATLPTEGFCRLPSIIKPNGVLPISRSRWYAGVASGEFPKPRKIGSASLWDVKDIRALKQRIDAGEFASRRRGS